MCSWCEHGQKNPQNENVFLTVWFSAFYLSVKEIDECRWYSFCYIKGNMCAGENGTKFKYLLMSLGSMNEKSINIKKGDKNLTFIIGQYI